MSKYAAKLLFQFRVVFPQKRNRRRTVEERIVLLKAKSLKAAIGKAERYGRTAQFSFVNNDGNRVHCELVGVLDLIELGPEVAKDEVWYDIKTMLLPMERKRKLIPSVDQLISPQGRTRQR